MVLSDNEKLARIRLMLCENVGSVTYHQLMSFYGTAEKALLNLPELARRGGRRKISIVPVEAAEAQIERACQKNTTLLFYGEQGYPLLLKYISDAPPILYVMGNPTVFDKPAIAMVGTRNASLNGKALTRKIAHDLAEKGYNVVSGLARGIDRAAHVGALSSEKWPTTTAVLGTPVDEVYPQENADIYNEIKERGCLISEFAFGTVLTPRNFPMRNRIISGISKGTLVIEAQEKSGSLITAREAAVQGRDVLAVPGSPVDPRSSGPNSLIRDGAVMVCSAEDVIQHFESEKKFMLREEPETETFQNISLSEDDLIDARQIVMDNLGPDVISVDELIRETGLDVRAVNIILVELEIAGRLERYRGNRVSLIYGEG